MYISIFAIIATLIVAGAVSFAYIYKKRKRRQLLSQQIDDLESKSNLVLAQKRQQVEAFCALLADSHNLKADLCWNDYDKMCEVINRHFGWLARKLQQTYNLSEREVRLCVLSLLNLGYDTMAEFLYYAPNGIGKFKVRVAKKLGTSARNLRLFLIEIAIGM